MKKRCMEWNRNAALITVLALTMSCGDTELHHVEEATDEHIDEHIVEEMLTGEVFEFEFELEEWGEDFMIDGVPQPHELTPDAPFRGVQMLLTSPEPRLEYQLSAAEDVWSEWEELVPQSSFAGMHGAVLNLDTPAIGMRFRTPAPPELVRFELFADPVQVGEHDHEHSHPHDDDSLLLDDEDYMRLAEEQDDDLATQSGDLSIEVDELLGADWDEDLSSDWDEDLSAYFMDDQHFGPYDNTPWDEELELDWDEELELDWDEEFEFFQEDPSLAGDDDLRVREQELITSCSKERMAAYSGGRSLGNIDVIRVDHKRVAINTASAYEKMRKAAASNGVNITVVSGFRTMAEQQYLYNCYVNRNCNNGNLAARPGYSNHQNGWALDLNTASGGVYTWLSRNASRYGFVRTVPSEPWHWEYRAGTRVSPQVCSTPSRPPARYNARLTVQTRNVKNFYKQGASKKVPDAMEGDQFLVEVRFTNRSNRRIGPVRMGYQFDRPHVRATNYRIQSDAPHHNRRTWRNNSANNESKNPPRAGMGRRGTLHLHSFAPGETKRILVNMQAGQYSLGRVPHANMRFWIRTIPNVYGPQPSYTDRPGTNRIGHRLRERALVDVLSRNEWQFATKRTNGDLEGWAACNKNNHSRFVHNKNHGAMSMRVTGPNACMRSPAWTNVNANQFDQIVMRARSHDGAHEKAITWVPNNCPSVSRAGGSTRWQTSAALSRKNYPNGARIAVLAAGTDVSFDAMSGATLAASLGGPLLITGRHTLPAATAAELRRLSPNKVIIIGGGQAVSGAVARSVRDLGISVERIAGETRFQTAGAVARRVGAPNKQAVIVSGENTRRPLGVLGAALASSLDMPVLFVQRDQIPPATRSALTALNIQSVIVIGGESAVSKAVYRQLPNPRRIAASTSIATSRAVAEYAVRRGVSPDHLYVSRGPNPIDALSAAATGDIVLFTQPQSLDAATRRFIMNRGGADRALFKPATIVGNGAAVSAGVHSSMCLAVEGQGNYTLKFRAPGNGNFQNLVIPMGEHPNWRGNVRQFRIHPLNGQRPAQGESGWYDVQRLYLQSSTTKKTSSHQRSYVTNRPVTTRL